MTLLKPELEREVHSALTNQDKVAPASLKRDKGMTPVKGALNQPIPDLGQGSALRWWVLSRGLTRLLESIHGDSGTLFRLPPLLVWLLLTY